MEVYIKLCHVLIFITSYSYLLYSNCQRVFIMKLKPRLAAVASVVPAGSIVADIGADHGYLSVYLAKEKNCPRVVAVEKSARNAEKARETVLHYNVLEKVDVRVGDGISALEEKDGVDVLILAGLGGLTICRILLAAGEDLQRFKRIVLQPMGDLALVRRFLFAYGFSFVSEKIALERGFYYEIIAAEKGVEIVENPLYFELGPRLLEGKDPLFVPWLKDKMKHCEEILQALDRAKQHGSGGIGFNADTNSVADFDACADSSNRGRRGLRWSYFSRRYKLLKDVLKSVCPGE